MMLLLSPRISAPGQNEVAPGRRTGHHVRMARLLVATCQFSVSADIAQNAAQIKRQMTRASRAGARVAHFAEGALSGYAGTDFDTFGEFDCEV